MILVLMNHLELTTESNSNKLSIMRFCARPINSVCVTRTAVQTYLTALFQEHLVVLAQGNAEDDGCDVFEAVDPLLAFASLPADIKHAARRVPC
jgi:hypothetical protein